MVINISQVEKSEELSNYYIRKILELIKEKR